jgi:superfamily II DNA or RNA helicase
MHWKMSYGMPAIIRRHLDKKASRVIVFCAHISDIEEMSEQVKGWFREAGFSLSGSYIIHNQQTDSEQREQMTQFESNDGEGLRLMFSVNILNEGVHVPGVNAVLMLRTTSSRIIFMQQMGRCLTVANTTKPLVLDMVDNITTTTAISDVLAEYDQLEVATAKMEGREPRPFEVIDYTLGIREVIEKLVPEAYTIEERIKILTSYINQHGRLPKQTE